MGPGNRLQWRAGLAAIVLFLAAAALLPSAASAATVFADDFESGLVGWIMSGTPDWYSGPPATGTHSVQFAVRESIQRRIPTTGYDNIRVSFSLGAQGLSWSRSRVTVSWYNGNRWITLEQIGRGDANADGLLHSFEYSLPASAGDMAGFALRVSLTAKRGSSDRGYVDDIVVSGDPRSYAVSLETTGAGSLRVNGAAVTTPWSQVFPYGTELSLEAVPEAGSHFGAWSGDLTGSANPTTLVVDGNKAITAEFITTEHVLNLMGLEGSVRVDGTTHALPWSGVFTDGATVALEAIPGTGHAFTGWSGDLTGITNPTSVTLDRDLNISAHFTAFHYPVAFSGEGSGSVVIDGVEHPLPWSGAIDYGTVLVVEALPADGYQFDGWLGDLTGTTNPAFLLITSDTSITVRFVLEEYALTVLGSGGGITVDGTPQALPWSGTSLAWTTVALGAVPDPGYRFGAWTGDHAGSANPTEVVMDGDKTITANFLTNQFVLNLTGNGGEVEVDGGPHALPWSAIFDPGTVVALHAVADANHSFASWSGDLSESTNPVEITMDQDWNIGAGFTLNQYLLQVSGSGGGVTIDDTPYSLPAEVTLGSGTVVTLAATPDGCMRFLGWGGDADGRDNPLSLTMDGAKTISASFDTVQVFTDVDCEFWAVREIAACFTENIVQGYWNGTYQPERSVTRDQMAVYISRALAGGDAMVPTGPAVATFSDVPVDHWAYRYVEYACQRRVVQGYPSTHYAPEAAVDRGQMAAFIARAIADPTGDDGLWDYLPPASPTFPDVTADNDWAWCHRYVEYIAGLGIAQGYWDGYHPEREVTRDQMAVYVARAFALPM